MHVNVIVDDNHRDSIVYAMFMLSTHAVLHSSIITYH